MHSFMFIATFQIENDETEQSERKTENAKGELISKSMVENWVQLLQVRCISFRFFSHFDSFLFLSVAL